MLFADATRKLQVKLAGTVTTTQLALVGAWTEVTTAGLVQNASAFHLATSNASPVTIVDSPASGAIRKLQGLMVVNQDTAQATLIVFQTDGVAERDFIQVTLDVGDNFQLRDDGSWSVINSGGQTKGIGGTGAAGAPGVPGIPGTSPMIKGEDGATILVGTGLPIPIQGRHRDLYLDRNTFNIYRKRQQTPDGFSAPLAWVLVGNIIGKAGLPGPPGQSIRGQDGKPGTNGTNGSNGIAYGYPSGYRISVSTGVSVPTTDQTAQGTVYLAVHKSLFLLVPNTSATDFDQQSPADSSLTWSVSGSSGDIKDLYVWNNSGSLTTALSPAWSSSTSRGSGAGTAQQTTLKGITVNAVTMGSMPASRGIYLGTIRLSGANVTADSGGGSVAKTGGQRFVYNAYNQVLRQLAVIDTGTAAYTTQTYRQWNSGGGANGNKIEYVAGESWVEINAVCSMSATVQASVSNAASIAIGVDSTSTPSGLWQAGFNGIAASGEIMTLTGTYRGQPGLGYHSLTPLEYGGDGSCTFNYSNSPNIQSGLNASILM